MRVSVVLLALLVSPGLAAQTPNLVIDINRTSSFEPSSDPTWSAQVGPWTYFFADAGQDLGVELHRTMGTPASTQLVADINPGAAGCSGGALTTIGSTLFFRATDGVNGIELWKSDGGRHGHGARHLPRGGQL